MNPAEERDRRRRENGLPGGDRRTRPVVACIVADCPHVGSWNLPACPTHWHVVADELRARVDQARRYAAFHADPETPHPVALTREKKEDTMSEPPQDPKPLQYDRAWVQTASPERIEEARQAGQLNDLLGITSEDGAA